MSGFRIKCGPFSQSESIRLEAVRRRVARSAGVWVNVSPLAMLAGAGQASD